ncbi:MAG: hypothetical protein IJT94_13285, partial [Oscillibacter sp.]|nr:hypothetical protein [Oscillibacter sp.]
GYTYLFIAVGGGMVLFMGLLLVNHICGTLDFYALETCVRMTGLDGLGGTAGFSAGNAPWPAVADELGAAASGVSSAGGVGIIGSADGPTVITGSGFLAWTARALAASSPLLPAGLCILVGFGAKAGMYPLHVWLPMAHPVAPSPASALLSGILTKVGVYGVMMTAMSILYRDFSFGMILLVLGLITMFLGAVLALFSVNLKRTLACSSMSQIGFIFIGMGSAVLGRTFDSEAAANIALSGTMLHMVNHSLFKLVLFLAAGAVVMNLHVLTLDDIRGWGRNKPVLKLCFALGGLGISGVPLLNGYLSKTLLHEGILHVLEAVEEAKLAGILSSTRPLTGTMALAAGGGLASFLHVTEWVFLISGGCTLAYMLKLFICVFCEKNADPAVQARYDGDTRCMDRLSSGTLLTCALILVPLGQPAVSLWLASRMTGAHIHFEAFAWENLKGGLISLTIGAAVYLLFVRPVLRPHGQYVNRWPAARDVERVFYRGFPAGLAPAGMGAAAQCLADNVVLKPVCRFLVFFGSLLGRTLSDSTDALAVLLRRTAVLREVRRRDEHDAQRVSRIQAFRRASGETLGTFFESFSFTLLMACVGIILIFTVLAVML